MPEKNHNVWTLAATGIVVYYVIVMTHELLGHSLIAYF